MCCLWKSLRLGILGKLLNFILCPFLTYFMFFIINKHSYLVAPKAAKRKLWHLGQICPPPVYVWPMKLEWFGDFFFSGEKKKIRRIDFVTHDDYLKFKFQRAKIKLHESSALGSCSVLSMAVCVTMAQRSCPGD